MTVDFYTFAKRRNSTLRPTGNAAASFNCVLKEESGVLSPTLEIYNTAAWNPSALNYAHIVAYSRWYWVDDWTWIGGRWECTLSVDVLASYEAQIKNEAKYVLRASYDSDWNIIDSLYPATADAKTVYEITQTFGGTPSAFARDFDGGTYVVGIANPDGYGAGAVSYYAMSASELRSLVNYMLIGSVDPWTADTLTTLWGQIVRSVYDVFSYIKSCIWLPVTIRSLNTVSVKFGNFDSGISAGTMPNNMSVWPTYDVTLPLPSGWGNMRAKYRAAPNAQVYIQCNPFGMIAVDPSDLGNDTTGIRLHLIIDVITGEALLELYRVRSAGADVFLSQYPAQLGIDINLSSASINAGGMIAGAVGIAGGIAGAALTGGATAVASGIIGAAGSAASAAASAVPTANASVGRTTSGAAFLTGEATLIYTCCQFVSGSNQEFGEPLCQYVALSTLYPGYIKCMDGHTDNVAATPDELEQLSQYLTDGFYLGI